MNLRREAKLESSVHHATTIEYFGVDRIDKEHVSDNNASFVYDGIGALDNLRITYKPSWLIDLIIDRDSIQVYTVSYVRFTTSETREI